MGMAIEAAQPRFAGLGGSALQGNRDPGWGFQTPRAMANILLAATISITSRHRAGRTLLRLAFA